MRGVCKILSLCEAIKQHLWEIRDLANMVYDTLPEEHRYLFENSLKEDHS